MKESKRTQREKAYEDEQDFEVFCDESLDDEAYFEQLDSIEDAFKLLVKAGIIVSRTQFAGAIVAMQKIPVPMKEAAAIAQVSCQSFRRLEARKLIKIIRRKPGKQCFIKYTDLVKYIQGRNFTKVLENE